MRENDFKWLNFLEQRKNWQGLSHEQIHTTAEVIHHGWYGGRYLPCRTFPLTVTTVGYDRVDRAPEQKPVIQQ